VRRPLVDPVTFFHTLTLCRSRYFRQLQEISDSVGEAQWNDVDIGLALQRNAETQTELDRKIITGRARQRYVRTTLFRPARSPLTHEFSSPICLMRKTLAKMKRMRAASYVTASLPVDTSHDGEARSSWSMLVHRC
jgi:hypothetical protein